MKSHRIEDLKVWSKSMAWVKEVYLVASELPDEEKFGLVSHMRRCAVSIHQILQKEQEEIIKMNFTVSWNCVCINLRIADIVTIVSRSKFYFRLHDPSFKNTFN